MVSIKELRASGHNLETDDCSVEFEFEFEPRPGCSASGRWSLFEWLHSTGPLSLESAHL